MTITVEVRVRAPIGDVWKCWTTPEDIVAWNSASDDWHTTTATVELTVGGRFSSRMEARDGSAGFDFEGTYTRIEPQKVIAARFGDRQLLVEFIQTTDGVVVRETFDAEDEHPEDMQRQGWQAILDRFGRHVEAKRVR